MPIISKKSMKKKNLNKNFNKSKLNIFTQIILINQI